MNRFPRVFGLRNGYDPGQVDALIQRIEATLGRGVVEGAPVTADDIRMARFNVKLGGYNEVAVDFALDAFVVAVETLARGEAGDPAPAKGRAGALHAAPVAEGAPAGSLPGGLAREAGHGGEAERSEEDDDAPTLPGLGEKPGPGQRPVAEALTAAWLETQAARVERVLFRPGRLGAGYNEDEVDVFLDRVVATLRGTTDRPLTAEQVRRAAFSTVVFKTGYAVAQVDAFLAEIADVLERRGSPEEPPSQNGAGAARDAAQRVARE
ncbi:DivIVA domain-containing protein [Sphaerisporangium sp. TRM90804]|uniref:DivIVA domain-containing protein n=1 Tax=Sphaerisporangium sp. TRM90804 TaxID=3031113 RepID=UPI0024491BB5|nr:DivIVA domain-containing protein [Sphaerisporangium sp. TRM90804]MDH2430121.1 DivIVA domain-containing protein [Sphaerisporangium sp. TRM90804]